MKENFSKILGTLIFVLLILILIFLIFFREKKVDTRRVEIINLKNNFLLTAKDYLKFSKLDDQDLYENLTLPVIKARIEKHPYVKRADVEFEGLNKVKITLDEKNIKALLLGGNEPFLITEDFEVLPLLLNTKVLDLPVISNPGNSDKIIANSSFKNEDIIQAFKILDTSELINKKLKEKISEINLRNGRDILLTLSGLSSSIIFGRKDEVNKMYCLDKFFAMDKNNLINRSSYIDLRFSNHIYIGGFQNVGFTE